MFPGMLVGQPRQGSDLDSMPPSRSRLVQPRVRLCPGAAMGFFCHRTNPLWLSNPFLGLETSRLHAAEHFPAPRLMLAAFSPHLPSFPLFGRPLRETLAKPDPRNLSSRLPRQDSITLSRQKKKSWLHRPLMSEWAALAPALPPPEQHLAFSSVVSGSNIQLLQPQVWVHHIDWPWLHCNTTGCQSPTCVLPCRPMGPWDQNRASSRLSLQLSLPRSHGGGGQLGTTLARPQTWPCTTQHRAGVPGRSR